MKNLACAILAAAAWSTAAAEIVAHGVTLNGRVLRLSDQPEHCKNGGLYVELSGPNGLKMHQGCWTMRDVIVHIDWDDGDKSDVPAPVFKKGDRAAL